MDCIEDFECRKDFGHIPHESFLLHDDVGLDYPRNDLARPGTALPYFEYRELSVLGIVNFSDRLAHVARCREFHALISAPPMRSPLEGIIADFEREKLLLRSTLRADPIASVVSEHVTEPGENANTTQDLVVKLDDLAVKLGDLDAEDVSAKTAAYVDPKAPISHDSADSLMDTTPLMKPSRRRRMFNAIRKFFCCRPSPEE